MRWFQIVVNHVFGRMHIAKLCGIVVRTQVDQTCTRAKSPKRVQNPRYIQPLSQPLCPATSQVLLVRMRKAKRFPKSIKSTTALPSHVLRFVNTHSRSNIEFRIPRVCCDLTLLLGIHQPNQMIGDAVCTQTVARQIR